MIIHQRSLPYELKAGAWAPEKFSRSLLTPHAPMRSTQNRTPSVYISTWRLEIRATCISTRACGSAVPCVAGPRSSTMPTVSCDLLYLTLTTSLYGLGMVFLGLLMMCWLGNDFPLCLLGLLFIHVLALWSLRSRNTCASIFMYILGREHMKWRLSALNDRCRMRLPILLALLRSSDRDLSKSK